MTMSRRGLIKAMAVAAMAMMACWPRPRLEIRRGWIVRKDDT